MIKTIKKITIIGDGGWGTALSVHLTKKGYDVTLWGPFPDYVKQMAKTRVNKKFLPGIRLPRGLKIVDDYTRAIAQSQLIVFAVPSKYALGILKKIRQGHFNFSKKIFLSATKGIETKSLLRMSEMIRQELGPIRLAVLSGPNIASEVAKGIPSTAVAASTNINIAKTIQTIFNTNTFRIYTNTDLIGVELGGSLKNIIAIACGICDGLGYGTNTKAAILTRGLAEMATLGQALGTKTKTFFGLSSLGDLVTTCFSPSSRNRSVGEALGSGQSIRSILSSMKMVAEGVETVKATYQLSRKLKISMPITTEIYNIIYKGKKPSRAVNDLMNRQLKSE